ncbi:hypothetical protein TCON_2307 [Astathelohania contejeani]|uniref:Uncharacterized protein n=1 Tax=Astathelohania contejeani TaxID=164912 RepID=A0ABQ7HWD9_9MICR|nr:hypothetical protein TCON_2307 [Thelohania contejeani]
MKKYIYINICSGLLMLASAIIFIYIFLLHHTDLSLSFSEYTKSDFLKMNAQEIKNNIFDGSNIKIPIAGTVEMEGIRVFHEKIQESVVQIIRCKDKLVILNGIEKRVIIHDFEEYKRKFDSLNSAGIQLREWLNRPAKPTMFDPAIIININEDNIIIIDDENKVIIFKDKSSLSDFVNDVLLYHPANY